MTESKTDTKSRPTPASLPKLTIKPYHGPEPEHIPSSKALGFIQCCAQYRRAPVTMLPKLPSPLDSSPSLQNEPFHPDPYHVNPPTPATLCFTHNDWVEIEQRKAIIGEKRAEHAFWLEEMRRDPSDQEVLAKVQLLSRDREENNAEISRIYDRKRIRRRFRADFNGVYPGW
ncbi:Uu.00g140240.m01.CDS01 [Anthostomella pinea]|uniref:Uu.00g140240.m01.CDS01 n=1 Tax=Anthostomella pinea TaxID=933095 RepID=A0AAI8VQZ1_9PEZI|nr:Uu.00g140240.m01.CDS01 [Anthostomella pinea]